MKLSPVITMSGDKITVGEAGEDYYIETESDYFDWSFRLSHEELVALRNKLEYFILKKGKMLPSEEESGPINMGGLT